MSVTPLAGLKVIELSHTVMGPAAGLVFAELDTEITPAGSVDSRPAFLRPSTATSAAWHLTSSSQEARRRCIGCCRAPTW